MVKDSQILRARHSEREIQPDAYSLFIIGTVWVVLVALVHPVGDFPLNDDWVYALAVKSVLETGYFQFPSPSMANVGPQVYWGALFCLPFGFSFTALRFSTLVLGLIGVVALYGLIRQFKVDAKTALFGALTMAVNPIYFGLANSFMSDVPFITLVLIALYFIVRGLQKDSTPLILIGLVITYFAILIRQFSLVILLGFALAYPVKKGFTFLNLVKVTALVLLGALLHIVYQYWLMHSGRTPATDVHTIPYIYQPSLINSAKKATVGLIYIGFFVLPFIVAIWPSKFQSLDKKSKYLLFAIIAYVLLLLGFLVITDQKLPLLGNILMDSGLGPLTLRDTFNLKLNIPVIPQSVNIIWSVITFFSVIVVGASIYFVGLATHEAWLKYKKTECRETTAEYALILAVAISYLVILLIVVSRFTFFDRYLLLFLPLAILLLANIKLKQSVTIPPRYVIPGVIIVLYAIFSVGATHDFLEWNRTRWIALHDLVNNKKIPPRKIDGGYEFNGWFLYDANYKQSPTKSWWWVDDDEYVLTAGPLSGYVEFKRYPVNRWLKLTAADIIVLRRIPQPN